MKSKFEVIRDRGKFIKFKDAISGRYYLMRDYVIKLSRITDEEVFDYYSIDIIDNRYFGERSCSGFNRRGKLYEATKEQIEWLEACRNAGEFIEFKNVVFSGPVAYELWD